MGQRVQVYLLHSKNKPGTFSVVINKPGTFFLGRAFAAKAAPTVLRKNVEVAQNRGNCARPWELRKFVGIAQDNGNCAIP